MVKQFFKKKSKRQSCKIKYKIEKKVREHDRKQKKEAKKRPKPTKRKKSIVAAVPNKAPFKDIVIKEAEQRKIKKDEERAKAKLRRKDAKQKEVNKKRNLDGLQKDAQNRATEFEEKKQREAAAGGDAAAGAARDGSLKAYYREFRKVVEMADVVLQVLDARDPIGSRCYDVESAVLSAGTDKKLVLVLNKIDLVPREIVTKWLQYLRNEFPTIAFKASTQNQRQGLSQVKVKVATASDGLLQSGRCVGADLLMKLLGNYCKSHDIRVAIRVGVVGLPNVGKSSIINSLKRGKACSVGATPGVTKTMQLVQLDKHISLLDSPGIVMPGGGGDDAALRNCVKLESVSDPLPPVAMILRRCSKQNLMLHYRIPDYADLNEFLALMAKRTGRLKKGGIPDVNKAARIVLQDWNSGKITFYTHPPEQHSLPTHVSAEIVTSMAGSFDIAALQKEEETVLKGLKPLCSPTDMIVETSGPVTASLEEMEAEGDSGTKGESEEEDDELEEEEEDDENSDMEDDGEQNDEKKIT
ncbi:PREDICTED: guanine nucleotide-binding protein-like 3 homolog [Priapulus caudatus]|uniref:Guanine nucleotide-binding protein-like 3 homolog n=1 Tax=Priapulus caudatus TaxID=37621 RepID=A0ABM1EWN2_PRICU|nr:PREDICTED: guanine nucleotide-binding protein-like 3 homolog [Priapulus caudatus]